MISTLLIIKLLWIHLFADFFLQSDAMAKNKSSSNKWLTIHVIIYSLCFIAFGWKYALLNGIMHWSTDFVSSRITTYLWKKQEVHWFFVVIGIDQALHMTALVLSIPFMGW